MQDSIWIVKMWFRRQRFDLRFNLKKIQMQQISWLLTDAKWNAWIMETLMLRMQLSAKTAP